MNLTNDEIIDLMDCVNIRIDELMDYSNIGDWQVKPEVERLNTLVGKLGGTLEAITSEQTARDEADKASADRLRAAIEACRPKPLDS